MSQAPAAAETAACAALRARIEAPAPPASASSPVVRQVQEDLERIRAYAEESGCTGGATFDDSDPSDCEGLRARAAALRQRLARLGAEAAPEADGEEERRAAIEAYNASCSTEGGETSLPTPDAAGTADPGAPPVAAPAPTPETLAQIYCVRRCDGAFYPLAVDVPRDRLAAMDQLCQAQCPAAEASAYAGAAGDIAEAQNADGAPYSVLPAAFRFQKGTSTTCTCRAPGESWAATLAKAEAMIEAHPGDVTVTPEIQARMEAPRPAPPARSPKEPAARAKAKSAAPSRAPAPKPPAAPGAEAENPGIGLTRELRRSAPTL